MEGEAVKVAVCVPFRTDHAERQRNWDYVRSWLTLHHGDWPIFVGSSDRDPFSPAQARNNAARAAGDWDVAVFWDSDSIAHPDAVRESVRTADESGKLIIAGSGHTYMDELSTQRYLATGLMFPQPTDWPDTKPDRFTFDKRSVYRAPCSGILAVPRRLWEQTGGYVDSLEGVDSHEDLIFWQQCVLFGEGVARVEGMKLHLWHPTAGRVRGDNHRHYNRLVAMTGKTNSQACARDYLEKLGHVIP